MTKNYRKIRAYDPETEDKRRQLLARRDGLCERCNFGLLCILNPRADAKLYYFRAMYREDDRTTGYGGISMRRQMLCISEEEE